jgi:hypothetical protein
MISAMLRAPTVALPWVLLFGLAARQTSAQTRFEISGGYALAHDPRDEVTLPSGWMAGAAIGVTPALSVVGEISGQYKTIPLLNADARLSAHTAMGGLRASANVGRLTEFAQILAGVARTSGSAFGATDTSRAPGIQPGVGVDYPLARAWAARAELDVRLIRSQPDATNGGHQYRFAAALVYRVRPR